MLSVPGVPAVGGSATGGRCSHRARVTSTSWSAASRRPCSAMASPPRGGPGTSRQSFTGRTLVRHMARLAFVGQREYFEQCSLDRPAGGVEPVFLDYKPGGRVAPLL